MTTAQQHLKHYFGFESFRGLQEQIITHINAKKDCLVLMPTGGGKSVCYQIPALMMEGITLVVSPLISLMKDQVDALKANGISAAFMNSSLNQGQEDEIAALCFRGQIKLLYMSPEKALSSMNSFLSRLPVSFIAIDEAHCVSQWGHDFRPEYRELNKLRTAFSHLPVMALTATADKITRNDILNLIGLHEPGQFVASFDRPNISLSVRPGLNKKDKIRDITRFIAGHKNECGIIYCTSRDSTEKLALELKSGGIIACSYHAGMPVDERNRVQEDFINDNIQVVCATIAFGMGIDKSNVRFVIHYNLPKSIENYYQEIGRGGRDGLPCDAILYYSLGDLIMLRRFAEESGQRDINVEKLKRMQEFAEARHCRRRILLNYFSQNFTDNCGNCDVCLHPPANIDATLLAQKALSGLTRINQMGEQVGMNLLMDVLRGLKHKEIFERRLNLVKTYGAGSDLGSRQWNFYLLQMIQLGVFEIAYDQGNSLQITGFGEDILKGKVNLYLNEYEEFTNDVPEAGGIAGDGVYQSAGLRSLPGKMSWRKRILRSAEYDQVDQSVSLFEKLRNLRKRIAVEEGIPPYVVFHDSTLHEMVEYLPTDETSMLQITGVSETKMKNYGQRFLNLIRSFRMHGDQPTEAVESALSEGRLLSYMNELKEKGLRFSAAVVGNVLAGSGDFRYGHIASKVSFNGVLAGRMSYKEVSKRIKPFYEPYEQEIKEAKQSALLVSDLERQQKLDRARAWLNSENQLSPDEIESLRERINAIPLQKQGDQLSDAIKELRKSYPRSHEPWGVEEETLLKETMLHCRDLNQLVELFGRSENSILAMSLKWI